MASPTVRPSKGLSREEAAKLEMASTTVSRFAARSLIAFFVCAIAAVPVLETVGERWSADERVTNVWARLAEIPAHMTGAVAAAAASGRTSRWERMVAANRAALGGLAAFEHALEDESVFGRALRPPAQRILSGWLGTGNERVYVGRNGWLFYRPDLEYLTGPGFLDSDVLRRRIAAATEWTAVPHPDPRPAILEFHHQLTARGIALILVPTPVKPGVHPEKLNASYGERREVLQNPSYGPLIEWLRGQGVLVFDPASVLGEARQSGPQYLTTDTHWRPEAMELVAERLAAFVNEHLTLPTVLSPGFRTGDLEVTNPGDTAVMLDLPSRQQLYPPERALIRRVLGPDGGAWRSERSADVIVLGDSFANIYSLASMGWGDSAGLVEQLSYVLARPVDRIVQNDDGAFATRAMLQRSGPDRLAGKRVVVWQFAARELAFGDWKVLR